MRIPKTNFRKVVFMTRAQEIRKERMKFYFLDLFEKVKFLPPFVRIVLCPHRGNTLLLIKGMVEKVTSIPYTQNNLVDLIELFKAEDGYDAYWSDKDGNRDDSGTFVTVVMDES